jgi:hypothetical protein
VNTVIASHDETTYCRERLRFSFDSFHPAVSIETKSNTPKSHQGSTQRVLFVGWLSTTERAASFVAMQQRCRPLYSEQSGDR